MLGAPQRGACNAYVVPGRQRPGIPCFYKFHKLGARLLRGQIIEEQPLLQPQPLAELQHRLWVNSLLARPWMCQSGRQPHGITHALVCPLRISTFEVRAGTVIPMQVLLQLRQHSNVITSAYPQLKVLMPVGLEKQMATLPRTTVRSFIVRVESAHYRGSTSPTLCMGL